MPHRDDRPATAPATKPRAPHNSRNGPKVPPPAPAEHPTVPAFEPVPRKFRHDGWTPARQKAFIGALADTGNVSRAARHVNMSPEGAYWLRRQPGSETFRRAWEAALDLGVQRLKDELYERALEGQLVPVFVRGQLKGFKRVKNDRLLMFALRMNAKDEYGRRMAATYFDPAAPRLHGGSGTSGDGDLSPRPGPARITDTVTGPAVSRMRRDDRNAAIVAGFDPAELSLPEIEAMQAMLAEVAARHQAEADGPPDQNRGPAYFQLGRDKDWAEHGQLESMVHDPETEDTFLPDDVEESWHDLHQPPPEQKTEAEWLALAQQISDDFKRERRGAARRRKAPLQP